jgi:hypothetical protein
MRSSSPNRTHDDQFGEPAEVLRDSRERKLKLGAAWPTQSQTTLRWDLLKQDLGEFLGIRLFDAQKQFFKYAWQTGDDGRLRYSEQVFGAIKKTGKSGTAAMHVLTTTLVYGGRYAEAYCVANDLEQAQGRVFTEIRKICESSPLLRREAEITQSRITFPQTGAIIQAIGSDYASAAGAHPVISSFDELWGYTSERSRRLFDELVPVPTQRISCRLTTTHAGYSGDSTLLEEMCKRGEALPEIAPGLHAGNHLLFFWSHEPLATWQTDAWLAEMRQITRPIQFIRQFENRFVTSENSFIVPRSLGSLCRSATRRVARRFVSRDLCWR